jgi:hypothetical protein
VDLGELGELYRLPAPSATAQEARDAAEASMEAARIAPQRTAVPLIACVYLAPLAQHLGVDFAVWLEGQSRSMKSTLAALMAAHFGAGIERTALAASWLDTANAIGFKLFTLADCLAVIDDYAPQPSLSAQKRMDNAVAGVVRGIGNRAGRGRLSPDIRLQKERKPRALAICTAEQWPHGESINARLLGLELKRGYLDLERLTLSQQAARKGLLARAMSDHLERIAGSFESHLERAAEKFLDWRERALSEGLIGRAPEQSAFILVGYSQALEHWQAVGCIAEREAGAMLEEARAIVFELAKSNERRLAHSQPADCALSIIKDLLRAGGAHLRDKTGDRPGDPALYG